MSFRFRAFQQGRAEALAKVGAELSDEMEYSESPDRYNAQPDMTPYQQLHTISNIDNAWNMHNAFMQTSPMETPSNTNKSINELAGPGPFANKTTTTGGLS